jgi:hypothetical protein
MMFACVDGPDFDGHEVDFDDLTNRLRRFVQEEKQALEQWSEGCRRLNWTPSPDAAETAGGRPD